MSRRVSRLPGEHQKGPRRIRWALYAYPPELRRAEGDVLVSLASDLVEAGGSSPSREAAGLVRDGLAQRLGVTARAPWRAALRRVALVAAGAMCALVWGVAAWWLGKLGWPLWPGWSWVTALVAPVLILGGHLGGRRTAVASGALLLIGLGIAQANGGLQGSGLRGGLAWDLRGDGWNAGGQTLDLPLLAYSLPLSLVVLASAAHRRQPLPRSVALAAAAWVVAGAVAVRLLMAGMAALNPVASVNIAGFRLDGVALCMAASAGAVPIALGVAFARRHTDPAGLLAATLGGAAACPVLCMSVLHVVGGESLSALVASSLAAVLAVVTVARSSAATEERGLRQQG